MYDELVSELREKAEFLACAEPLNIKNAFAETMKQAADAIEQLIATVGTAYNELANNEANKPRWIPVTERLPEDGSLVGKLIADSNGCIRIASQCTEITLSGGKTVYTDLIDLVSLLAKDTPTTEWTDCTHITHWMPLPEGPK